MILNQKANNIKKYFIQVVQLFKEQNLIEDNYKIISNGYYSPTKELNTRNISEGFVIYEKTLNEPTIIVFLLLKYLTL